MKLSFLSKFTVIIAILMSFCLASCEADVEDDTDYSFKIISTGDDFTGYYSINGGDDTFITTDDTDNNPPYYYFSRSLSDPSYIRIHADGNSNSTTYIGIEVYADNKLVETSEVSQSDTEIVSVTCSYDFDSESSE